jgi:GTP-binding protein Era
VAACALERTNMNNYRSGFVTIIGRPNAGKSTLLNALVGQKVAIVADKPQTTRTAIQGVLTDANAQVVFLDTPGIHKSDSPINKRMMSAVRSSLEERDALVFVVDATKPFTDEDEKALSTLREGGPPVILALNKVDALTSPQHLLPLIDEYAKRYAFKELIPISATKGEGLDIFRQAVIAHMPEGPQYFPEDHVTDQPARFLVAELIREKILRLTRQEIPHSVTVLVEQWDESQGLIKVYASILVERDGQKGIVIGAGGSMLKRIGTEAREEAEALFGMRFFLDLRVRVEKDWRQKQVFLNTLDWRTMAGRDDS